MVVTVSLPAFSMVGGATSSVGAAAGAAAASAAGAAAAASAAGAAGAASCAKAGALVSSATAPMRARKVVRLLSSICRQFLIGLARFGPRVVARERLHPIEQARRHTRLWRS